MIYQIIFLRSLLLTESRRPKISMTENGDPLENATAERINGIIKDEYLYNYQVNNVKVDKELLQTTVERYNTDRPHMRIGNYTPEQIHQSTNTKKKRNYGRIIIEKNKNL